MAGRILRHALAVRVQEAEVVLGPGVALIASVSQIRAAVAKSPDARRRGRP